MSSYCRSRWILEDKYSRRLQYSRERDLQRLLQGPNTRRRNVTRKIIACTTDLQSKSSKFVVKRYPKATQFQTCTTILLSFLHWKSKHGLLLSFANWNRKNVLRCLANLPNRALSLPKPATRSAARMHVRVVELVVVAEQELCNLGRPVKRPIPTD